MENNEVNNTRNKYVVVGLCLGLVISGGVIGIVFLALYLSGLKNNRDDSSDDKNCVELWTAQMKAIEKEALNCSWKSPPCAKNSGVGDATSCVVNIPALGNITLHKPSYMPWTGYLVGIRGVVGLGQIGYCIQTVNTTSTKGCYTVEGTGFCCNTTNSDVFLCIPEAINNECVRTTSQISLIEDNFYLLNYTNHSNIPVSKGGAPFDTHYSLELVDKLENLRGSGLCQIKWGCGETWCNTKTLLEAEALQGVCALLMNE